ncbi:ABC-2 transporter permease [Shouchella sp. JSM 1781072]|uniref:ABC-2 transporter permease n=1 Tax=Shouchella sp. JSM 1781072 TaxID=3344581 RepID=UPI0035C1BE81
MKGLMMNQYYSVEKSIWVYAALSLVVPVLLLVFFERGMLDRLAAFIPIAFMVSPALEVLKHEAKSGWSKYVATLPVSRPRVVQSHYLFFILLMVVGIVFAVVTYLIATQLFNQAPTEYYIVGILNIIGIVFISGIISYPLTYFFGTEKSDMIMLVGLGGAIGIYFLSSIVFSRFVDGNSIYLGLNASTLFSLGFLLVTFILFVISYIVSLIIYKRKEF